MRTLVFLQRKREGGKRVFPSTAGQVEPLHNLGEKALSDWRSSCFTERAALKQT